MHPAEEYDILRAGKKDLSALPVTADGWPLHPGGGLLPPQQEGGGAYGDVFGAASVLSGDHRHLQPVFTGT